MAAVPGFRQNDPDNASRLCIACYQGPSFVHLNASEYASVQCYLDLAHCIHEEIVNTFLAKPSHWWPPFDKVIGVHVQKFNTN